jgi:hypothetical protein
VKERVFLKERVSVKNAIIQFNVQGIDCFFFFDISNLKAGTSQTVKLMYPFLETPID